MKRIHNILLIVTIAWMIVIFIFSAQSGEDSSDTSGFITSLVMSIFVPDFDNLDIDRQAEILNTAGFIIRKGAHFTEYAILAGLSFMTVLTWKWKQFNDKYSHMFIFRKKRLLYLLISVAFSTIYAISDEIHQGFVDGRAPAITDVLIDSSGAICGAIFVCIIVYIILNARKKESKV